jgi:hypothetical protein
MCHLGDILSPGRDLAFDPNCVNGCKKKPLFPCIYGKLRFTFALQEGLKDFFKIIQIHLDNQEKYAYDISAFWL